MHVSHLIDFDVELSDKERVAIRRLLDGKYEVEKTAKLTVRISVELQDKKPSTESRTQS